VPAAASSNAGGRRVRAGAPVLVVVGVFVASRIAAAAAGVRFDDGLLHNAFQLLDVRLLRDDPIESIFYLHSQPPLFNAFTAVVLQLPASFVNTTLMLLWHAAGLATALLLYATMRRLGVRPWLAVGLVCGFVVMPETLLTESWFFYSQLEILLLALMMWALARFATNRTVADGLLFTSSLGALILLRSAFHPLVFVVLVAVVWRELRLDARKVAVVAAVPLILVGAWSAKNVVVFDSWSNSTWTGMNLSYLAHAGVSTRRCRQLVATHVLSPTACVRAFSSPLVFRHSFHDPHRYGVQATDALFKSTGQPNFNASLYIDVGKQYQRDAIDLLRHGGFDAITRAEAAAYTVWAEPADDVLQLRRVRRPVAGYADWFDRLVLLRPVATGWNNPNRFTADAGSFPVGDALGSISYTLLVLFGLAIYGGVTGARSGRRGASALRCVCVVGLILVVYSTLVGNALDYRENNRFRFETAPIVLLLGAVGAERVWQKVSARRSAERSNGIGEGSPASAHPSLAG
jgi:hypothetical protein